MKIIYMINKCGPLFFGLFIMTPVLVQIMDLYNFSLPFVSNIMLSLLIGFFWGTVATIRGKWI